MNITSTNLKAMSIHKLSNLRDQVDAVLKSKVAEERRAVEDRLGRLGRLSGGGARGNDVGRGVRGAVAPKYRSPQNPAETWAGRGLKPRWLVAALKSGKKLEDFSIEVSERKSRGRRKKAQA